METNPRTTVTEAGKVRPKLVIFDDDSVLLQRFTKEYTALGYAVTPVLVGVGTNDTLIVDTHIKQRRSDYDAAREADPQDWEYQDRMQMPERTVDAELAEAKRSDDTTGIAIYGAMREFSRGVTSKTQVRQLLRELKPDFVLSDLSMRRFADYDDMTPEQRAADDDTIMGTDIMALAKEVVPNAPRAIHSGEWTQEEGLGEHILARRKELHEAATAVADENGYAVVAKDTWFTATTPPKIDAYFGRPAVGLGPKGANSPGL